MKYRALEAGKIQSFVVNTVPQQAENVKYRFPMCCGGFIGKADVQKMNCRYHEILSGNGGKSTLMEIYQDYLRDIGIEEKQIIAINFEDYDFRSLRDPAKLHVYVKERMVCDEMTYVFLDEIQHVQDWQEVVDSFHIKKNLDIYITGSNAYLLSSEIATLISGRYVEIKMLQLSFKEFVTATSGEGNLSKAYLQYIESSSFPYALVLKDHPKELRDYLEGIYNTVVVKDLVARKKIPDVMMLESVARFVFDSIGSPMSTKKIADTMTSSGRKIDVRTVEKYVDALMGELHCLSSQTL